MLTVPKKLKTPLMREAAKVGGAPKVLHISIYSQRTHTLTITGMSLGPPLVTHAYSLLTLSLSSPRHLTTLLT